MQGMFIRDLLEILYESPEEMTDGDVLDAMADYLKERAVELGINLDKTPKRAKTGFWAWRARQSLSTDQFIKRRANGGFDKQFPKNL